MNCLFTVRGKATKRVVCVYDVKVYEGSANFLVYSGGLWRYLPASLYEPIEKGGAE